MEAGGASRLIEQLQRNEIVAVTEIPDDADSGWLGGFRVRDPTESGWFPSHVVSRVPAAAALKGRLAQLLPDPDDPEERRGRGFEGMVAEEEMLTEEMQVLAQLERDEAAAAAAAAAAGGAQPPEGDSDGDEAKERRRAAAAQPAAAGAGWTVAGSPANASTAGRSSPGNTMLASGAAKRTTSAASAGGARP